MAERLSASAGWELADAIRNLQRPQRESVSGTAVFNRRDPDGTCWVTLPGSDAETPVNGEAVASASPGDEVRYEIRDGTLSITGNASDPAVGATKAAEIATPIVERTRETLAEAIGSARNIADAAKKVADAVNQNFWSDTNGIHVTQVTQKEWEDQSGQSYQSGPNVLINSLGQLFRDGLDNLLTMTTENGARAFAIWDGAGNAASNVIASFGSVVRIGRSITAHVQVDSDSVDMMDGSQLLTSIVGINDNSIVGGRVLFNGGSKIDGTYNYQGQTYAERVLHVDAGDDSSAVDSSVAIRAVKSGNTSDIPYVGVDSDGTATLHSSSSRKFTLNKTGVAAVLDGSSADMENTGYDSKIQLRLLSSSSARVRVLGSPGETNVYDDHTVITDGVFTGYVYPDRTIMEGDGGKVSLRIGTAYEGVYDDANSAWIVGKHKTTGVVQVGGMVFRRGVVGQTNNVSAGSYKDVSVSFGHTYGSAPTVLVGLNSSSISSDIGQCSVAVESVSTTGFTARLFNASSAVRSPGFYWIALG